jgi:adenine phosphoribosyltransferase
MKIEKILKENIKTYQDYPIPGIKYFDLNPLYKDYELRNHLVDGCYDIMASLDRSKKDLWYTSYDYIAVIESRGFLIGSILAQKFNKGLILLRSKPGRLPGRTSLVKHTLEYGDSQMEVQDGKGKVLIFDDVLATGGTARAAQEVLTIGGYTPVASLFLVKLSYCNPQLDLINQSVLSYNE